MPDIFERLYGHTLTYLLGVSFLGFCWACYRDRPPVAQVAGWAVILCACLLALLFALAAAMGAA